MIRGLASLVLGLGWMASASALTPVSGLELNRYMGTWYEIASIPGPFQHRCGRDTRVEYAAAENGAIAVRSRCVRGDGGVEAAEGRGRTIDPALPAILKVTYVHLLGIWWYPLGRNQVVVALGPEYRWAVIGDPALRYGRILAREPALSDETLRVAAAALTAEGYDLCTFVLTLQTGGRDRTTRLCEIVR
jgi:apolipoprotein D and lipocalin family protein